MSFSPPKADRCQSAANARPRRGYSGAVGVLLLGCLLTATPALSDDSADTPLLSHKKVIVSAPYLDLRTGPGRGYPVTQSVLRGERIEVLYQRTGYVKVRTERKLEGWAEARALLEAHPAPLPDNSNDQGRP